MTTDEMKARCIEALMQPAYCGVIFTIPKGKMPKKFPRGEILNETERDGVIEITYNFDPLKVLNWMRAA